MRRSSILRIPEHPFYRLKRISDPLAQFDSIRIPLGYFGFVKFYTIHVRASWVRVGHRTWSMRRNLV